MLYRGAFARWRIRWVEVPFALQEQMQDHADHLAILDALSELGERQRACIALRYLEGLQDDQIAAVLGCRSSTVRSQIARGLTRLRQVMEVDDANG